MTEARWRQLTDIPLLLAGLLFYVVYALPILNDSLTAAQRDLCTRTNIAIWIAFVIDCLVRMGLSRDWRGFVRTNLLDLFALVMPLLRPLKIVSLLQSVSRTHERLRVDPHRQLATYGLASIVLLGFAAALTIYSIERHAPGATIVTFGDAAWWTLTTATTVGYGDTYPVTGEGRYVGAVVMIGGVAVLGMVSASVATWFTGRFQEQSDVVDEEQADATAALVAEIRALRERLEGPRQGS